MRPDKREVTDCFHHHLLSMLEAVCMGLPCANGEGQSNNPATVSIVLKDTPSPGTKPQVTPFVPKKLLINISF